MKKRPGILEMLPIFFALTAALFFAFAENPGAEKHFSADSLQLIRSLNFEHQMVLSDLSEDSDSEILAELWKADALISPEDLNNQNKGLIASLGEGYLLIQPVNRISDTELNNIADKYSKVVPEFRHLELDQTVVQLSGEPVYKWTLNPEVDLTEEKDKIVTVAVMDSGVDVSHQIFENHEMLDGYNALDPSKTAYDDVSHGTHVAGIVAANSSGLEIVPLKIVDRNGGRLSNVIKAFDEAIDMEVDIINTSFGLLSPSFALEELVNNAYEDGIFIVSAAGNNGNSRGFYPASYEHTIAVASVDGEGNKMSKSNYGHWVDIAANGQFIYSSLPGDQYGVKSGTSQAAPLVTARVAEILQEYGMDISEDELLNKLRQEGTIIGGGELSGLVIVD
ncbi:S8 family serine peptidase [Candidatus Peregrinibacteria bacterium]|jgi:hypothetical protein|nr:S8 family serine peptidase [Candidatus Peregrinibacteria bacterium]MBT4631373.1 S8 family serine peptidase [Candidatus Peregrinibacteria bacterium]MBT5517170.1 S8 family serine peptidase [Candidatus Peregrinibacteria bacterium]MBT5823752.1 S8 family serine peptidase [Candidatus Peregrinibacteria bacterium]